MSNRSSANVRRYEIEAIPMLRLFVATDSQRRIRLSSDIVRMYGLDAGNRVILGYDAAAKAIALKRAESASDPTAANVDKAGYISARRFFDRTRLTPEARRYEFVTEQDGWLVFIAEDQL